MLLAFQESMVREWVQCVRSIVNDVEPFFGRSTWIYVTVGIIKCMTRISPNGDAC